MPRGITGSIRSDGAKNNVYNFSFVAAPIPSTSWLKVNYVYMHLISLGKARVFGIKTTLNEDLAYWP